VDLRCPSPYKILIASVIESLIEHVYVGNFDIDQLQCTRIRRIKGALMIGCPSSCSCIEPYEMLNDEQRKLYIRMIYHTTASLITSDMSLDKTLRLTQIRAKFRTSSFARKLPPSEVAKFALYVCFLRKRRFASTTTTDYEI
jgi:hypothetical protein